MNSGNDILNELKSMESFLADIPRTMPFAIPGDYFDRFPGSVINSIDQANTPEYIPEAGKSLPYTVPDGYFEELSEAIIASIQADEFLSRQPVATPYQTPAGYFDTLPAQVLQAAKTAAPQKSESISLGKRSVWRSIRWAAAAMLIVGIGLGSYRIFINMPDAAPVAPEKILSGVPNNEIEDYLQHTYRLDVNRVVNDNTVKDMPVKNADIIQYLNETGWD